MEAARCERDLVTAGVQPPGFLRSIFDEDVWWLAQARYDGQRP